MGLQALAIIEEEIERIRPRLGDGPVRYDGVLMNDVLSSLEARLRDRITKECIEVDEATAEALERLADPHQETVPQDLIEPELRALWEEECEAPSPVPKAPGLRVRCGLCPGCQLWSKWRAHHLGEIRGWVLRSGHESKACHPGPCRCRRKLAIDALRALGADI